MRKRDEGHKSEEGGTQNGLQLLRVKDQGGCGEWRDEVNKRALGKSDAGRDKRSVGNEGGGGESHDAYPCTRGSRRRSLWSPHRSCPPCTDQSR